MKNYAMLVVFLTLFSITNILYAEATVIHLDQAKQIADRNAITLWENVTPGEPIVYYSLDDKVVAYRFNYAINSQFPDKQTLINECNQGKLAGNRKAQWGNGNYGNILMSARTDMPVNLEHGLGTSSEYAYGAYLQEQAEKHLGSNYTLKRIYYVNTLSVWYHYTNGTKDIYVKPHPPAKVGNEQEFRTAAGESGFFCETGDFTSEWEDYLSRNRTMSRTEAILPYHDECFPFYDWSYGCSPTAAAMLLAYWDLKSTYGNGQPYGKLVDYHFERYDPVEDETDTHVPNLQLELSNAMNTDLDTGSTDREDIAPAYETVANAINGYNFSASYHSGESTTWYFNEVVSEINSNRPLHISIENHSVCGVGYDNVDFEVATHYTHQPWIQWITRSQLQATYPVIPSGPFGVGVEIIKPDGDQDYYGLGSGETLHAGDVYEITWDSDSYAGSYVNIQWSLSHGVSGSWGTLISSTPNDGEFDWVIPASAMASSDDCRIRVNVYSSGNTLLGADGSYGDFSILSGIQMPELPSHLTWSTHTNPDYYKFIHEHPTWCAVAIREDDWTDNWNMKMYPDTTFTDVIETSATNESVEFVVLDGHHTPSQYRGIKAYRTAGIYNAAIDFSSPSQSINIGYDSETWGVGEVIRMYDIYLTPGTYSVGVDITSGAVDLDIALFGSSGVAYSGNRTERWAESINSGNGVDEQFTYTITTADYYGICVWANNETTDLTHYDLFVVTPGTWTGNVSTSWTNAANWSGFAIPDATISVTIPSGTPYQPTISSGISIGLAYCYDITIQAGAVLTQTGTASYGSYFYVNGSFNSNDGTFTQNSDYAYLHFVGSDPISLWDDNNEDDTYTQVRVNKTGTNSLIMWQDMTVKSFEIRGGNFTINAGWTLTVTEDLANAFEVETGGILTLQNGTIDVVLGDIEFDDGAQANVSSGFMKCGGDFRVYANTAYDIQFAGGTLEMHGTINQYYQNLDGNTKLYNLVINKSSGTFFVQQGDLHVRKDLTISSGILNLNVHDIYVGGDWTNSVGSDGFLEGTGTVTFNGTDYSQITTDETFYNLTLNSTSIYSNGLQLNYGFTATILNDLNIIDGKFELNSTSTLIVGNDVYIANGCGLNAYGDFGLEIFVGGDWTNDNTYWDTGQGYSPGTEVITFNGSADQFITTQAPQEDFGTLIIDKSGGEFRPNDNIHVMNDFYVHDGSWHDNTISLTHYFEGDFNIASGAVGYWNSTSDNTVVFTGLSDQTVFNTVGVGYFRNIVIDKTEWSRGNFTNIEGTEANLENQEPVNQMVDVTRNRNMTVTLMSDIDMQFGVGLTIEEGTLDLNGNTLYSMGDVTVLLGGTLVVGEGATLQVSNGNSLYVYNGGTLETLGSLGNMAHFTHRVFGNYGFNIYPGGMIKAQYVLFEYMDAYGIYVWNGGVIDRNYAFNYCTFQNGFVGFGTLLYINNADDVSITGANFPDASSSDFNVAKTQNPDWGTITMINATGIFAGEDYDQDAFDRINWDGIPAIDDLTIAYLAVSDKIVLNWTYPQIVDHFKIYRSTDPYDFSLGDVFISNTNWYSEDVTGIKYFYRVTADNMPGR